MNTVFIFITILLLLAGGFLLLRKLSHLYPWRLCTSVADWLILPVVGAYIVMLLAGAWMFRCAEWFAPRHASAASPPREFPSRATTARI